jgi:hypothetical protein
MNISKKSLQDLQEAVSKAIKELDTAATNDSKVDESSELPDIIKLLKEHPWLQHHTLTDIRKNINLTKDVLTHPEYVEKLTAADKPAEKRKYQKRNSKDAASPTQVAADTDQEVAADTDQAIPTSTRL